MAKVKRNIQVIKDLDGNNIVIINDILFKTKKRINWKDIIDYLWRYVDKFYEVAKTKDIVYIGKDFPKEFAYSKYSKSLNRPYMYARANIISALPEVIKNSSNKQFRENYKDKHDNDAKYGWYKFNIKFGLPRFNNDGDIVKYVIYSACLITRVSSDNKIFLYDIIQIKKEAG